MKVIICDIDGTIAKVGDRQKYIKCENPDWDSFYAASFEDEPIKPICQLLYVLEDHYRIVFCTGRRESVRYSTHEWLIRNTPYYKHENLRMRANGDHRHDTEVKPELIKDIPQNDIAFIIEDRNTMVSKWRELGYTVLQPSDGDF